MAGAPAGGQWSPDGVLFNSYVFVFAFLPVSLAGFFACARFGRDVACVWLIAASLVFYGWWNPAFLPLLGVSILANFAISRVLLATADRARLQGWLLGGAVGLNLAALVHYKYLAAMLGFLRLHGVADVAFAEPALPLGISFFTFTQIGYLADCRGLSPMVRRGAGWLDYALFVTFFPHLIAGPVLHHREIMPQFALPANFRPIGVNMAVGLGFFSLGLLKKCLLADPTGAVVAPGFAQADTLTLFAAWQVALSYSLQLYFDFSGYSDMAIGLARMFNIRFPLNFDSPYKSRDIAEFWRRWHISLSRFLRDHVYIPLGGNRRGTSRMQVNLMATMLLGGLWHGAAWNFVLWGGLHGFYLVAHQLFRRAGGRLPALPAQALTLLAVMVAWVPFRADGMNATLAMLRGMAGLNGIALPAKIIAVAPGWLAFADPVPVLRFLGDARNLSFPEVSLALCLGWAIALGLPHVQELSSRARSWALTASFALTAQALFFAPDVSPFLYFQF